MNDRFVYDELQLFNLIKQVQDRTRPSITLIPHKLTVNGLDLLVLEIPFTPFLCSTTKGEYLIRSNNGNRAIQPNEMATILSEKGAIVYDQKTWNLKDWQEERGLIDFEIVEGTGSGSGTRYLIHKKHNVSIKDKVQYSQVKKQEKACQKESILRYLDSVDTINNSEARYLLKLSEKDKYYVSRLLSAMCKDSLIEKVENTTTNNATYRLHRK